MDKLRNLAGGLSKDRVLIWKLAKNDFKNRYAGSYLGIVWAFVQPVVTILVYWFVFEKGFNQKAEILSSGIDAPYVLWLTAGLVPWFYFNESLLNGTTSLLEYNYLVKKVVFKISILPVIKIMAATFIHAFFVLFMLLLFACHGFLPDIFTLQVIYYSFALFMFVLALSYATCSIVIFFRDLTQIIAIIMQVGMWATPILWKITMLPEQYRIIFRINPVFYIVSGYRDSLLEKVWFWQHPGWSLYFWGLTIGLLILDLTIFRRLRVHFADVL